MPDTYTVALKNPHSQEWKNALWSVAAVFIGLVAIFYETAANMAATWWNFETYAHGFLIIPITGWLIWDKREHLKVLRPEPELRGLIILIGVGFLWLLGALINAEVVKQIALISMIVVGIWSVLGNQVTRAIMFPLAFLFFMVPVGEDLVPIMMEFTASFTVGMLQMTGIPVYREGLFFSIPSGNWSVVKACSGLRYLIASVTLGCVFAYITYQSWSRRVIFIVASFIVPIIANGLRAYMIVMIGHLSGMELAVGVDHLIYGWVFFGIVMFILFAVGSKWREPDKPVVVPVDAEGARPQARAVFWKNNLSACLAILLVAGMWPFFSSAISSNLTAVKANPLSAPNGTGGWVAESFSEWEWKPFFSKPDTEMFHFYRKNDDVVGVYLVQYLTQDQDSELVNTKNRLIAKDEVVWRKIKSETIDVMLNDRNVALEQSIIKSVSETLLVWRVYRLSDRYTANRYEAKLLEVKSKLSFSRQDSAALVFSMRVDESSKEATQHAAKQLQSFVNAMLPSLEHSMDHVVDGAK